MSEENRNIEDFFKKRLESKEFAYEEADWQKLSNKMDASGMFQEPGVPGVAPVKVAGLVGLTVVGSFFAGWYVRDYVDYKDESPKTETVEVLDVASIGLNVENVKTTEIRADDYADASTQESENLVSTRTIESNQIDPDPITEDIRGNDQQLAMVSPSEIEEDQKPVPAILAPLPAERRTLATESQKDDTITDVKNDETDTGTIVSVTPAVTGTQDAASTSSNESTVLTSLHVTFQHTGQTELPNSLVKNEGQTTRDPFIAASENEPEIETEGHSIEQNDETTQFPAYVAGAREEDINPETRQVPRYNRLSIGFALSSDFNSVGLGNQWTASLRPGILIYYRFFYRFRVSTGLTLNKKQYETSIEGYSAPSAYWDYRTNGILPSSIAGQCTVVDIPINVSYDVVRIGKWVLGASVGISSYILLDESYDFEFETANPGASTNWSTETNSNAPAGIVNMSIYASLPLGKRTELLVEPYFKAPVKEIGWGNVELYGSGFQFVLRYNLKI